MIRRVSLIPQNQLKDKTKQEIPRAAGGLGSRLHIWFMPDACHEYTNHVIPGAVHRGRKQTARFLPE